MIWTIALGILLGYIFIMALPGVIQMTNGILDWLFNILIAIGNLIKKCWRWIVGLKWYYKPIGFICLEYVFWSADWVDCGLILFFFGTYFVSFWAVDMIKKLFK